MWPYEVPHRGAGRARGRPTPADRPASPTARPTAARSSKGSPTPWRRAATSPGSARGSSAAAPTTTAASRCAWPTTTSSRRRPTASASTGRSATRTWRPTTTRPSASSASPARPKASAARPTASSTRRRRCARTTRWSSGPARSSASAPINARQSVTTVARNGRPPCHYCGQCGRGCKHRLELRRRATCRSSRRWQTGRVKVVANAMARELITDATGKVDRGLLHRQDHRHREAGALPHGGPGRQRLRVGAAAAQLEGARGTRRGWPTRPARSAAT